MYENVMGKWGREQKWTGRENEERKLKNVRTVEEKDEKGEKEKELKFYFRQYKNNCV